MSCTDFESQTLIIDNGSEMFKAGFSGDDAPSSILSFSSIHKPGPKPKKKDYTLRKMDYASCEGYQFDDFYYSRSHRGPDAEGTIDPTLILQSPIEHGIIKNWIDMEIIWRHIFEKELRVDPSEHPVLLTEIPATMNPRANREKITQIMFETFRVPSFFLAGQDLLSLYTAGRTSGVVVESGGGISFVVPVIEGYRIPQAFKHLDFAGSELTDWLQERTYGRFSSMNQLELKEAFRNIKEKKSYVALDYEAELRRAETSEEMTVNYELPNGEVISFRKERFQCPEILFKPALNGSASQEVKGIDRITYDSIMESDIEIRKKISENIVISGGSTLFEGFAERMQKEITALGPTLRVNVIAEPERNYGAWIGGSILSSFTTFPQMTITRAEYNENGPAIIHRKCF